MNDGQYRFSGFTMLPPVVKNLLIINGICFLAYISLQRFGIDLNQLLGLHYFPSKEFNVFQIITYMFMHANFSHLFFNMFALWMFGYILELTWGGKRFLTYYMVCGIGAALVHYAVFYFQINPSIITVNEYLSNPTHQALNEMLNSDAFKIPTLEFKHTLEAFLNQYNSLININPNEAKEIAITFGKEYKQAMYDAPVIVGASGAVYGILLAFGMTFPNQVIYIYFLFPLKAKWFVLIYGLIELGSGFLDSGSNVAHFAHLGGMIFGFALIKLWQYKREI